MYASEEKMILNDTLVEAAGTGQYEEARQLLSQGATDLEGALQRAAGSGDVSMIQIMILAGATDLDSALLEAAAFGELGAVRYLIASGATDLLGALDVSDGYYPEVASYIRSLGIDYENE